MIDPTDLPFTPEQLHRRFVLATEGDDGRHLRYYRDSAARMAAYTSGEDRLTPTKVARQIEEDERFWTAAAFLALDERPDRARAYAETKPPTGASPPLNRRDPERTLVALVTPQRFRDHPHARLYGWLMREYREDPAAIARDLPHRERTDWDAVANRLGWLTWEDIRRVEPQACRWLSGAS